MRISLSSLSAVALYRLQTFSHRYHTTFDTFLGHTRLIIATLGPRCRAIFRFVDSVFFNLIERPVSNSDFYLKWARTNPLVRLCYSQRKVFAIKMKQKFYPWDWEPLLTYTYWMCSSMSWILLNSFIGHYFNLIQVLSECLCTQNFTTIGPFLLGVFFFL